MRDFWTLESDHLLRGLPLLILAMCYDRHLSDPLPLMTNAPRGSSLSEASGNQSLSLSLGAGQPLPSFAQPRSSPGNTNSALAGILEEPLGRLSTSSNADLGHSSVIASSEPNSAESAPGAGVPAGADSSADNTAGTVVSSKKGGSDIGEVNTQDGPGGISSTAEPPDYL